jgi:hypothetical protein
VAFRQAKLPHNKSTYKPNCFPIKEMEKILSTMLSIGYWFQILPLPQTSIPKSEDAKVSYKMVSFFA